MKKELKGFVLGVVATSILATGVLVFAQGKKQKIEASLNTVNFKVNNNNINVESICYKNENYLSVKDIAEIVGKELSWDANSNSFYVKEKNIILPSQQINITQSSQQHTQTTASGTIKGIVTYQTKAGKIVPDIGSKVLLIPKDIKENDIYMDDIYLFSNGRDFDKFQSKNVFAVNTDSTGNYVINNIPEGKYVLIVVSNNTTLNLTNTTDSSKATLPNNKIIANPMDSYTSAQLTPLSKSLKCDLDEMSLLLFRFNRYSVSEIKVSKNITFNTKCNFTDKKLK